MIVKTLVMNCVSIHFWMNILNTHKKKTNKQRGAEHIILIHPKVTYTTTTEKKILGILSFLYKIIYLS